MPQQTLKVKLRLWLICEGGGDRVGHVKRWKPFAHGTVGSLESAFFGRGAEPRPDPTALLADLSAGACASPLLTLRQIHSARCLVAGAAEAGLGPGRREVGEGDALVTAERGLTLGVATADCLPLVAVDSRAGALAVVHAGWRGTLAGVLEATLGIMVRDLGARAARIRIAAGPAAGRCCYRVGQEVADAFRERRPADASAALVAASGGGWILDLLAANRAQARQRGVSEERFEPVGVCTICSPADCHSYRREGTAAGRMWLLARLAP